MKKRVLSVVMVMAMALSLVACGSTASDKKSTDVKSQTEASTAAKSGKGLKIAIVSSPSGVDDGSFNQDNYNGIQSFIKDYPDATVKAVQEPTGDATAAVKAVADIVADYDVIVCCGFQFAGISTVAQDNPNVKFILVDSFPSDKDGKTVEVKNIYAMCFAEQESGFFAGMAAALSTTTGKVAVVNGIAYPSNVNYQYGFECGVKYANGTCGTKAEVVALPSYAGTDVTGANVGGNYVGNFNDQATGKVVGNALISQGVDVLFVAAGNSGNGVFTAAKEAKGVKVIGCDVDQYKDGANGDSNIVLTSALKVMHSAVKTALVDVQNGKFKGANVTLTAQTDSTGYVSEQGKNQLSADAITKINAAYDLVKSGKIVPAANFNKITPATFTWK